MGHFDTSAVPLAIDPYLEHGAPDDELPHHPGSNRPVLVDLRCTRLTGIQLAVLSLCKVPRPAFQTTTFFGEGWALPSAGYGDNHSSREDSDENCGAGRRRHLGGGSSMHVLLGHNIHGTH